ncbi:MAG: MBL fold metallo-hydrolase [Hyphomonadaceae bacterium]|nr:MBL fold metallo-hydrolase [Hyphomonadaceae bacterium]
MNRIAYLFSATLLLVACSGEPASLPEGEVADPPPVGEATEATRAANAALAERLPLEDQGDFEDAAQGLLAQIDGDAIYAEDGSVIWPIAEYDTVTGAAPDTVNPSLWRQAQLTNMHGLFEVTDGIYQIRGYDLAVMSVIRGETGWIIVDPLLSSETSAAALKLVNDTLGARPVTGVIYTHSHADHFGGVRGVISEADIEARGIPVLAPIGFSESAVAENLLAGNHMSRRAALMFGNTLPHGPTGQVSIGLGPGLSAGTIGLIAPTEEISGRGTRRVIDGIVFEFVDAAGTEAPAEFMFYLPQFDALCTAEVATATFHNALTPRGAKVRDLLAWSEAIDHVLVEYGDADVVFASHHWPTWGEANVASFLRGQRDIYRYTHDQALRRANAGGTAVEIAEDIEEPGVQGEHFDTRGYYGTLNHNTKAVYQFYFGWWDGVPANYHAHPPVERARRFVAAMGGVDAVIAEGRRAFEEGDYRWAADVLNQAVFAEPENAAARDWLAASYEQMGFQAESGAWRAYFLTGAQELRNGVPDVGDIQTGSRDFIQGVPTVDLFDAMAVRFAPEKLGREPFLLVFEFTDTGETIALDVGPAVTMPRLGAPEEEAAATLTLSRTAFNDLILRARTFQQLMAAGEVSLAGDPTALMAWFGALETPPFWFNVVEP